MGQRRERRLQRARQLRVGAAVVAQWPCSPEGSPSSLPRVDRRRGRGRHLRGRRPARMTAPNGPCAPRPTARPRPPQAAKRAAIRATPRSRPRSPSCRRRRSTRSRRRRRTPAPAGASSTATRASGSGSSRRTAGSSPRTRCPGRRNYPRNGTYNVIRSINPGWSKTLRLPYFVGFTYGNTTDVGFHGIPLEPDGGPIQSDCRARQLPQPRLRPSEPGHREADVGLGADGHHRRRHA